MGHVVDGENGRQMDGIHAGTEVPHRSEKSLDEKTRAIQM